MAKSPDPFIVIDSADDVSVAKMRRQVDKYFTRTRQGFEQFGDANGLWAVYLRGPSVAAFRRATGFMVRVLNELGSPVTISSQQDSREYPPASGATKPPVHIYLPYQEGDLVRGGGQPIMYYYGPGALVSELETGLLQRLGPSCIAAANAREMARILPHVGFIDMAARHCPDGSHNAYAYGASVGSAAAQRQFGAVGFVGTSTDETAHWFGKDEGMGSMPHAFVNRAGSTLEAAKRYHTMNPHLPLIVLVDFFGREVSDSLEVARHFNQQANEGKVSVRLDTHGARFLEGLDIDSSHDIIERYAPHMLERKLSPLEQKWLFDKGVSVASVFKMRQELDKAGFPTVKILASSGFSPEKCALFAEAKAPVDMIGTGSYLPRDMEETFAKSETLGYVEPGTTVHQLMAKEGREWVLAKWQRDVAKAGFTL